MPEKVDLDSQVLPSVRSLRDLLALVPSPVIAIGVSVDGQSVSFIASTFVAVSLDPPVVSVSFQSGSSRWATLQAASRWGITVLRQGQGHVARQLAGPGPRTFNGISTLTGEDGEIFVAQGVTGFSCAVRSVVEVGDHDVAFLDVLGIAPLNNAEPLVFHSSQFRRLSSEVEADANWLSETEWQ